MNSKYSIVLTAIVLATGLSLPVTHAQASQFVLTSMFNDVLVQPSPLSLSLSKDSAPPPPPVDGRPDERTPAGTRATKTKERNNIKLAAQRSLSTP
jgi:hypothetical protein